MSSTQLLSDDSRARKRQYDIEYRQTHAKSEEQKERDRAACRRYHAANKDKAALRQKTYRAKHPEKIKQICRASKLKAAYGLTLEQFDAMFETQGKRCLICKTDTPIGNGWQVDHCHSSGVVRGILCHHCNTGLGAFKDDPNLLAAAISYLSKA